MRVGLVLASVVCSMRRRSRRAQPARRRRAAHLAAPTTAEQVDQAMQS